MPRPRRSALGEIDDRGEDVEDAQIMARAGRGAQGAIHLHRRAPGQIARHPDADADQIRLGALPDVGDLQQVGAQLEPGPFHARAPCQDGKAFKHCTAEDRLLAGTNRTIVAHGGTRFSPHDTRHSVASDKLTAGVSGVLVPASENAESPAFAEDSGLVGPRGFEPPTPTTPILKQRIP